VRVPYGWETFFTALSLALASTDSAQNRLAALALGVRHLKKDSFPDEKTWKRFENFMRGTTRFPAKGIKGRIQATTSQMSDGETHQWLQEALGIFSELAPGQGKDRR
jgi:hypothetical protein